MAQGIPAALADSTALPEIGGEAGWYFSPEDEAAITATLRDLLDDPAECARRIALGRTIADRYRWQAANDLLVRALVSSHGAGPRPSRRLRVCSRNRSEAPPSGWTSRLAERLLPPGKSG